MIERRKKMIEVALPLEAINKESAREKSIRHGHPSTLHLWWARRPLAACRAVLFAQMVDDPDSDPAYRNLDGTVDYEAAGIKRAELFNLIEELVKWENSNDQRILNRARAEIARCVASRKIELGELQKGTIIHGTYEGEMHPNGPVSGVGITAWEVVMMTASSEVVNHVLAEYTPPVLDPFAGGGSIPLEAQRLGLQAYASDLNPVAVLINKALIEIPPKFAGMPPVNPEYQSKIAEEKGLTQWHGAQGLAEDVRYYGEWMRVEAEKSIGRLYPKVKITDEMVQTRPDLEQYKGKELTVIAWLWARTVKCPNPACGRRMPMLRSFWLSTKKGKEAWADPILDHHAGTVSFAIRHTGHPPEETSNRTMARCLFCSATMKKGELRRTASAHGMAEIPLAIVAEGTRGRVYLESTYTDLPQIEKPEVPEIDQLITDDKRWFSPPQYGLPVFGDLFTPRQLTALLTFSDLVGEARAEVLANASAASHLPNDDQPLAEAGIGPQAYADAVATYMAFSVSKATDYWSNLCSWHSSKELIRNTFGRQALPMVWDYAEANPFQRGTGGFGSEWSEKVLRSLSASSAGSAKQLDATNAVDCVTHPVFSTDPPYYDNIGYADLSDFFYVWLRRSLKVVYPQLLSTMLTPKTQEMIASPYRHDGSKAQAATFFEEGLGSTIGQWRKHGCPDFPTTVFYAFKQAETTTEGTASTGWETFLTGVINHGFAITGTWPMRTEMSNRMVGSGTNALASSVVLACVPRQTDAPLATRRQFIQTLKTELPDALRKLQSGSIAPVDLAQAAIGPGMGVFSRYSKVIEADGEPMTVRSALTLINQILDEVLAEQEGEFDADTRWTISWFEQYGMEEGPYGVAETLSKAKNTSVQGLVEAGILTARGGKVKVLGRNEMLADWDPATDKRLTGWEAVQYLIRELDTHGEATAACLLQKLGSYSEIVRDLAYRLYAICERKKLASEALAYNSLIVAWPEISKLSRSVQADSTPKADETLFE